MRGTALTTSPRRVFSFFAAGRVTVACFLGLVASSSSGFAADASASPTGTIKGRVLNETTGRPQPQVAVTLTTITSSGERRKQVRITDRAGGYVFGGLRTGRNHVYTLDARYRGGTFAGAPIKIPANTPTPPVIESTLRVWATTSDPSSILLRRNDMFVSPGDGALSVIENVTIVNVAQHAYIGRGGQRAPNTGEPTPTIGFALPRSASARSLSILRSEIETGGTRSPFFLPELLPAEYGFSVYVAVPPRSTARILFSYRLEGAGGVFDLSRTALYTIADLSVHATEPVTIRGDALQEDGVVRIADKRYERWSARRSFDPGDAILIEAAAEAGMSPWLLVGAAGGLAVVVLVGFWAGIRRRPQRPDGAVRDEAPVPETKEDLLVRIAELDLAYQSGDMSKQAWSERRAALKARLTAARADQPSESAPRP